jgi:hypothetical protein
MFVAPTVRQARSFPSISPSKPLARKGRSWKVLRDDTARGQDNGTRAAIERCGHIPSGSRGTVVRPHGSRAGRVRQSRNSTPFPRPRAAVTGCPLRAGERSDSAVSGHFRGTGVTDGDTPGAARTQSFGHLPMPSDLPLSGVWPAMGLPRYCSDVSARALQGLHALACPDIGVPALGISTLRVSALHRFRDSQDLRFTVRPNRYMQSGDDCTTWRFPTRRIELASDT